MVVSRRLRDVHRRVAGVEQREAAGAVGRLHHAGLEAALPDGRRLLVAGDAENAAPARRTDAASVAPKSAAQSRTSGSSAAGTREQVAAAPRSHCAGADIEQQRARGIGGIGRVDLAAGQPPQQEAVDGAEGELAGFRRRARAVDMVEQPGDLRGREIRIEQQPGALRRPAARGPARAAPRRRRAVRRSCQTMALWIGLPVARSQIMVVSRWLVMPIAAMFSRVDARRSPSRRARSRPRRPDLLADRARPSRARDRSARNSCCAKATGGQRLVEHDGARRGRALVDRQADGSAMSPPDNLDLPSAATGSLGRRAATACFHELRQRRDRSPVEAQSQLRPSPEHVVGRFGAFLAHQVAHLGGRQFAAETLAEIGGSRASPRMRSRRVP